MLSFPRRSQPAKYGEDRFGPPSLERSGSELRRAVSSLSPEGERVGVRGGALFNGKEGRGDFRKNSFFNGKEGFCPLEGEPKGSKRLLKVGFRKSLL